MESAPENIGSTPPQETNVASQLEDKTTPMSPIGRAKPFKKVDTNRWKDAQHNASAVGSQAVFHRQQREDSVHTREAIAHANSQHSGGAYFGAYGYGLPSPGGIYIKRPSDFKSSVPLNSPEKPQKTKQGRPDLSTAAQVPQASPAKFDVFMVERSIEILHERADRVALQRRQEKDEVRLKILEIQAQVIEAKIRDQQRTLEGLYEKRPQAQAPKEEKKDQPPNIPLGPLLGCEAFHTTLPAQKQPSTDLSHASAPGDKTTMPGASGPRAEPTRPDAGSPENEWTNVKLEDAEIPLGQEEWEDDIVSVSIPKASAKNSWWLNMDP